MSAARARGFQPNGKRKVPGRTGPAEKLQRTLYHAVEEIMPLCTPAGPATPRKFGMHICSRTAGRWQVERSVRNACQPDA
eukprot:1770754-Pleurochrysis_carterae.AAC.2